jgi:hypothetical protein
MIPDRDHSVPRAKIAVCIAISDPAQARRMVSLLSGDSRFDVQLGVDDGREADVILADHVQALPRPSIVIDDGERSPGHRMLTFGPSCPRPLMATCCGLRS